MSQPDHVSAHLPIRAEQVKKYLLSHGWRQRSYPRPEVLWFEGPQDDDGKAIEIAIGASESLPDYQRSLQTAVAVLSHVERRPTEQVVNDLSDQSLASSSAAS